jgi:hypothetical protein
MISICINKFNARYYSGWFFADKWSSVYRILLVTHTYSATARVCQEYLDYRENKKANFNRKADYSNSEDVNCV